jgi:hypothetical protein
VITSPSAVYEYEANQHKNPWFSREASICEGDCLQLKSRTLCEK